jgi:plasmid stability protein
MPTLYVENVPDDLYDALRKRARARRSSISAEVLAILGENAPTAQELARRKELLARALRISARRPPLPGPFPSTEEMQREGRDR